MKQIEMIKVLVLLVIFEIIGRVNSFQIRYKDCSSPKNIKRYQYNECENFNQENAKENQTQRYAILQKIRDKKLTGFKCRVVYSRFTLMCGVWSHERLISIPEIEIKMDVTEEQCKNMVKTSSFQSKYDNHGVAIGEETVFAVNELGMTHTENSGKVWCQGQKLKIGDQIIDDALVMTQYKVSIQREKFLTASSLKRRKLKQIEALNDHVILPCDANQGSCKQDGWTYIWDTTPIECPLMMVQIGNFRKEGDYLVDHELKLLFKPTSETQTDGIPGCPTGKVLYTDQKNIVLSETMDGFPWIDHQIDLLLYSNQKDDYLMYTLEKQTSGIEAGLSTKLCSNENAIQGHPVHLGENKFGKRRGDILYTYECPVKTANIKGMGKTCVDKIPTDEGVFIDPITKIGSKHAAEVDCNEHFPLTIKTAEGWLSVSAEVRLITDPQILQRTETIHSHESMKNAGIYRQDAIDQFENILEYGEFHESLIQTIGYGLCRGSNGPCLESGHIDNTYKPTYDIKRLERLVTEKLSLKQKFDNWLKTFGTYISVMVIIGWLIQLGIIGTITVITILKEGISKGIFMCLKVICFYPNQLRIESTRNIQTDQEERRDLYLGPVAG